MSLFQTSVLKQHLSLQDNDVITKAYKKYTKYFLNPTIQDNIRSSKEEEYQGIFLTELFVNILDYTLKPKADFNLVAEYKNQNNARKADGAILKNDIVIGVIELKAQIQKTRSEESHVGKECRYGWGPDPVKKQNYACYTTPSSVSMYPNGCVSGNVPPAL